MSSIFFSVTGLILFVGAFFIVWSTFMAVRERKDPRRLILWGALHDLAIICMALSAPTPVGVAGIWLYAIFQCAARLLAFLSLKRLAYIALPEGGGSAAGVFSPGVSIASLTGLGARHPFAGAMFAFGMLAAVGGTPFLAPEGRALITLGLLEGLPDGGFWFFMLMAAMTTIFLWLYVDVVCDVWLKKSPLSDEVKGPGGNVFFRLHQELGIGVLCFACLVALLGLFRGPLADVFGAFQHMTIAHAHVHISFWWYYLGAFATGFAFFFGFRHSAWLGVLFSAIAFASVCASPAGPLANFFLFVIALVGFVVALYSVSYIHSGNRGFYWFFLLLTFGSLAGIVSASNVAGLFSYWELMTFASYFLVVYERNAKAFSAALKYYVMCGGGALFMLPGLLALGVFSQSPAMALQFPFWLQAGLILCLAGFGVKAGLVPMQAWLPDAHPAAPSSISAPLSGIITKMGFFGLISIVFIGVGPAQQEIPGVFGLSWFGVWLCLMGAATLIYGEAMALVQTDIKRMLAFSTMGQIGEVALVLGLGTWFATAGALWHIFNHAIMKDLLFLCGGALIMRAGSRELADLRGLGRYMPVTVACMCCGLVSIMGLPPFGAFYSKFLMIQAAVDAGHIWIAVLLMGGALAGAIYYTRILKMLVLEERPASLPAVEDAPFWMKVSMLVLAMLTLVFGLAPQLLMPVILPVASLCQAMPENAMRVITSMSVNWPIYVLLPVFGAAVPAVFYQKPKLAGWTSVGILLLTAALVAVLGRGLDTLSYCFALLAPTIGAINMAYAVGYMSHYKSQWRFYCAFTCMCGGIVGMAASQHLLSFFLFWEVMSSWALYLAIAHEGVEKPMREAFKYFIFNLFGGGFIFIGLAALGPDCPFNAAALHGLFQNLSPAYAWFGMALLCVGFLLKAAQLPFRIDWQMHPALAPTPVSGYISSVLLKSAIIGLLKLFMLIGGGLAIADILDSLNESILTTFAMWVGGITIIMAAIQALRANGVKLVFIYSTVSQLGYMVLAVACGGALGYAGGMLHLVNHLFFKDLLFLACGAVMFTTGRETLDELGGIGRKMPFTLLMFAIGGLSVVGVPPTSGFSSKWIIYQALMAAGEPLLALLSLLGSVLTLAYIAKFLHAAFLGQAGPNLENVVEAPLVMRVPMGILAAGCVLTGIFPGLALYPINSILAQYGSMPLHIGLSGILAGPGAWNATAIFVLMGIAFLAGLWFVRHFVRLREVDIHSCGLPPETSTSRMNPASIYGSILDMLTGKENR